MWGGWVALSFQTHLPQIAFLRNPTTHDNEFPIKLPPPNNRKCFSQPHKAQFNNTSDPTHILKNNFISKNLYLFYLQSDLLITRSCPRYRYLDERTIWRLIEQLLPRTFTWPLMRLDNKSEETRNYIVIFYYTNVEMRIVHRP